MTERRSWLPGVHAAPNIQGGPDVYEVENRALDPEGRLFDAMRAFRSWDDALVADLGAGTGFWVPHFHEARHVFAIEPHGPSRLRAMARFVEGSIDASVLAGSAEWIPLPDRSVDVVHARFAYFWGPGCEPGLVEIARVLRPGGAAFVIDNDLREGTFAEWLRAAPYARDPDVVEGFWEDQGYARIGVRSAWRFERREDLEAVVRLELPSIADRVLAEHRGCEVDYEYVVYARRF